MVESDGEAISGGGGGGYVEVGNAAYIVNAVFNSKQHLITLVGSCQDLNNLICFLNNQENNTVGVDERGRVDWLTGCYINKVNK